MYENVIALALGTVQNKRKRTIHKKKKATNGMDGKKAESFNTNILHQLYDYTITFVNSQR